MKQRAGFEAERIKQKQWVREFLLIQLLFIEHPLCASHWQYSNDKNGRKQIVSSLEAAIILQFFFHHQWFDWYLMAKVHKKENKAIGKSCCMQFI